MHFIFPMTSFLCIDLYFCLCHFSFAQKNFIKISYGMSLLEVNYFRFCVSEKKYHNFTFSVYRILDWSGFSFGGLGEKGFSIFEMLLNYRPSCSVSDKKSEVVFLLFLYTEHIFFSLLLLVRFSPNHDFEQLDYAVPSYTFSCFLNMVFTELLGSFFFFFNIYQVWGNVKLCFLSNPSFGISIYMYK